jgi:hypothetical protein
MPSSFNGADLFGPGPHRFSQGPQGLAIVPNSVFLATWVPGSTAYGPLDLDVIVTGRLVADNEAALWAQRDAIAAVLTFPPTPATLIDHHGREWTDMTFYRFEEGDRTDRGRKLSLTFRAHFRKDLTSLDG